MGDFGVAGQNSLGASDVFGVHFMTFA